MLKWAEALESGKYEQTTGNWGQLTLGDGAIDNGQNGKFCCLNVASMIHSGLDIGEYCIMKGLVQSKSFNHDIAGLEVGRMLGWDEERIPGLNRSFVVMNDVELLTFPQIAAEIRKMVDEQ